MEYKKIKSFKKFTRNNLETLKNDNDKEIPKEIFISPEERQKIIDNLISIIIV